MKLDQVVLFRATYLLLGTQIHDFRLSIRVRFLVNDTLSHACSTNNLTLFALFVTSDPLLSIVNSLIHKLKLRWSIAFWSRLFDFDNFKALRSM